MIEQEVHGNVLVLRINRPEARNAVNAEVAQGIEAGLDRLDDDEGLWVGVLTGSDTVFCAGADLKLIGAGRAPEMATRRGGFAGLTTRERTKPLIAAVEGPALAGGLEVILACDLVVASRASVFGLPEVKRSLLAAAGATHRLPAVLPLNVALEMGMTGDPLPAERMYQLGLVNVLVEPGTALAGALDLAGRVAANGPLAVQKTRALMIGLRHSTDAEAFAAATHGFAELGGTEDFQEGVTAFIEKRPPRWKGR